MDELEKRIEEDLMRGVPTIQITQKYIKEGYSFSEIMSIMNPQNSDETQADKKRITIILFLILLALTFLVGLITEIIRNLA